MKLGATTVGAVGLAILAIAGTARASLLVNGNLDAGSGTIYFDGFDPGVADDVPGWILFLGAADGSYVMTSPEATPCAGVRDADMGIGPAGGGLRTAPGSRPLAVVGDTYTATVTSDNYFGGTGSSFFIDWFDVGGNLISSAGGPIGDPNTPLTYDPYGQTFTAVGAAPAGTVTVGVRFTSGNASYAGLAADNFTLVPEPASLCAVAISGLLALRRRRRA